MTHSETIGKISEALAKAQLKIEGAVKDSANPFYKSKYADLSTVWDACHVHLNGEGIAIVQSNGNADGGVQVTTMLSHSSGEWIKDTLTLYPKDTLPQSAGSAITYGRRYSLASMTGVCPVDDDGEATMGRKESKPVYTPKQSDKTTPETPVQASSVEDELKAEIVRLVKADISVKVETAPEYQAYVQTKTGYDLVVENYQNIIDVLSGKKQHLGTQEIEAIMNSPSTSVAATEMRKGMSKK